MNEQLGYIDKIVSDLQDFARPLKIEPRETDIAELFEATLSTVKVPDNIKAIVSIEEGFPRICLDPGLMRRVLINLVTNSVQAMPDGEKLIMQATRNNSGEVTISVEDTGKGIPDDVKLKLFQPLYTTKPRGQGFGLAVCRRVIEAHGGSIDYESIVDMGTRFTVRLPLAAVPK